MMDLTVVIDNDIPAHAAWLSLSPDDSELHLTVSLQVSAQVLAALHPELAKAAATAIDEVREAGR